MKRTLLAVLLVLTTTACAPDQAPPPNPAPFAMTTPLASTVCHEVEGRADSRCSPGLFAHSPDVLADAPLYKHTLCQPDGVKPRWIAARRPPKNVTDGWKRQVMAAYGMSNYLLSAIEGDHIGALQLDGDPGYVKGPNGLPLNFYPQLWDGVSGAHAKDREEDALHSKVCSGVLKLDEAQHQLIADWVK